ncbi:hypothetical protein Tco_0503789 [Tanacetum coccineum]
MDDPNITMEEYIMIEEEKARRHGKVFNWETAKYGKIWDNEDVHDLGSVETEFLAIVFDDAFTSKVTHSCEPTKQTALAISTTEAEYVSAGKACQQALWMKQALIDYDVRLDDVSIIWRLDELAYGIPLNGPYQTNLPSIEDIISSIRIDRDGQVRRIRHEEEIDVYT